MRFGLGPRVVAAAMLPMVAVAGVLDVVLGARAEEAVQDEAAAELERLLGVVLSGVEGVAARDRGQAQGFADGVGRAAGVRLTLIAPDGTVLADSEVPPERLGLLDNHASRPEVVAALRSGRGRVVRYSRTLSAPLMYAARPGRARDGPVVVRLALSMARIEARRAEARRSVIGWTAGGLGLSGAVMSAVAWGVSRRLRRLRGAAERMARGDLATRVEERGPPEVVALARAMNRLAGATAVTIARLEDEGRRLRAVLEAMNDGVAVTDARCRVVLCNRVLRERSGWKGDPVGRPLSDLLRAPEAMEVVQGAIAGRAGVRETTVTHPTPGQPGGIHPSPPASLLVSASPLPGGQGAVVVVHDTTEAHRLHRVRRDFVANVSHELRNPIATIQVAAETLQDLGDRDAEARRIAVEAISRHAARLGNLVADLLDLSRLESGQHGYVIRPVRVGEVVEVVLSDFEAPAREKPLTLSWAVEPEDLAASCDPDGLATVLRNLVDNAVRYTRPGDSVRVLARPAPDGGVVIEVSDTGPGIEEAHLPRLFERFYRVDPGRSRGAGGTGLGLAIARHAAEAMGGGLTVHSAFGRGATFRLTLPGARGQVQ